MRIEPRRLRRTLNRIGVTAPLLEVAGETFTADDDEITSVSISHGGTSPSPGIQPSTCETVLQKTLWMRTGQHMTVRLTAAAAASIANRTGGTVAPARIRDRFTGRIGAQDYDDHGDRLSIRLAAASWSAQLSRLRDVERWYGAGMQVSEVIRFLVATHAALPQIDWITYGTGGWDVLAVDQPAGTIGNLLSKMTSEIGVLVRDTRAGRLEAWPLAYRRTWAVQELERTYPITRSQAISPAKWSQPNENMPAKVAALWIGQDGTEEHVSAGGTDDSIIERHDWRYLRDQGTDNLRSHWRALASQQHERILRIPSIKIDVLMLLASDRDYHRGQAGLLLGLNAGDTIGLSGDWYTDLQGIHVVSGIDEQITGSSWTLTLSLIPWRLVFSEDSPNVPALVWESATYPWADESRRWNMQEA